MPGRRADQGCVDFLQWALPRLGLRWAGFRKGRRHVCRRIMRRLDAVELPPTATAASSQSCSALPACYSGGGRMAKEIELRRHTDNEGDVLTRDGIEAALALGATLRGGYYVLVSSGAQRATQTLACLACALGERISGGAYVESGLRSEVEERWRRAYRQAGSGE